MGGEKVSFQACKLLTKAYYSLLRDTDVESKNSTNSSFEKIRKSAKDGPKSGWHTLLNIDTQQVYHNTSFLSIYTEEQC